MKTLADLLQEALSRDRTLQFSSVGLHKDDLEFRLGKQPVKKFEAKANKIFFDCTQTSAIRLYATATGCSSDCLTR